MIYLRVTKGEIILGTGFEVQYNAIYKNNKIILNLLSFNFSISSHTQPDTLQNGIFFAYHSKLKDNAGLYLRTLIPKIEYSSAVAVQKKYNLFEQSVKVI